MLVFAGCQGLSDILPTSAAPTEAPSVETPASEIPAVAEPVASEVNAAGAASVEPEPAQAVTLEATEEEPAEEAFGEALPVANTDATQIAELEAIPETVSVSTAIVPSLAGSLNDPLPDLSSETPDALIGGNANGVSFVLISLTDGRVIAHRDAVRPMLPASTAKLLAAMAAFDRLSPDHRFATRVCETDAGLVLIGGGDPLLGVDGMMSLALQTHRSGAVQRGMRIYHYPGFDEGHIDPIQPPHAPYNPRLSDLMVAEGAYRAFRDWSLPAGAPPLGYRGNPKWWAHPDPTAQAVGLFADFLSGMGHWVEPSVGAASDDCPVEVARHESEPVSGLIREMLWTSSNAMAELVGRAAVGANDPTIWLTQRYGGTGGLDLPNFSGLTSEARVNAFAMARLLSFVWQDHPEFAAALTPAGWDGSLRNRLREEATGLRIWAKTGSMNYGVGLAGYAFPQGGTPVAFAIYAFDEDAREAYDIVAADPPRSAEAAAQEWNSAARRRIDRIMERLITNLSGGIS